MNQPGCTEFHPVQEAETTHRQCPAQAEGGTQAMDTEPGLHGEGEANTKLQMARKGDRVPIRIELQCSAAPVQLPWPTSVVRITL